MDTLYYIAATAAVLGGFFVYNLEIREKRFLDSLQNREDKINLRIELITKMQAEHGDNCLRGLEEIKLTLKEIQTQINEHTMANTALSIEMERIKSNMDGVVGKVEQMERLFQTLIVHSQNLKLESQQ